MSSDEFESYTPVKRLRKYKSDSNSPSRPNTVLEKCMKSNSEHAHELNFPCVKKEQIPVLCSDEIKHGYSPLNSLSTSIEVVDTKPADKISLDKAIRECIEDVELTDLENEEDNNILCQIPLEYINADICEKSSCTNLFETNELSIPKYSPYKKASCRNLNAAGQKNLITNYFASDKVKCTSHDNLITDFFKSEVKSQNTNPATNMRISKVWSYQSKIEGEPSRSLKSTDLSKLSYSLKKVPPYKIMMDSKFAVDAFKYGIIPNVSAYFLTHFHYDHYQGLSKKFTGPIFCSDVTANLIEVILKVPRNNIRSIPLEFEFILRGYKITFLEANHCPGSVLIYMKGKYNILHTGDFRAEGVLERYGELLFNERIDVLYLDTTYLDPYYSFPSQSSVLKYISKTVTAAKKKYTDVLVVSGTYTIGKEKVFLTAAEALNCKIWANKSKIRIYSCLNEPDLKLRLTDNKCEARVHVLPMKELTSKNLVAYVSKLPFRVDHVIGLRPSGWEFRNGSLEEIIPQKSGNISLYGLPYSEHSSYVELESFVKRLNPRRVIPTVCPKNCGWAKTREYINAWIS